MSKDDDKSAAADKASALGAGQEVLHLFYDLTSLEEPVREEAACQLAFAMEESQKGYSAPQTDAAAQQMLGKEGVKGLKKAEQALRKCSPLTVYALRRLARGLGSSHDAARQGFALALAAALARVPEIESLPTLDLLDAALEVSKSMKGADAREGLLGRIFGYAAFSQAGRAADLAVADRLATSLVAVMGRKAFLREAAANALLACAEALPEPVLARLLESNEAMRGLLLCTASEATPEGLLLAVRLWARMPAGVRGDCALLPQQSPPPPRTFFTAVPAASPAPVAASAAFFSGRHLQALSEALVTSSLSHPRIHSLWFSLLALLLPGFTPTKVEGGPRERGVPSVAELGALWDWVESHLFTNSHERKYLAFQLFGLILPSLRAEHVPLVFTPRFLRTLVNSFGHSDAHLHAAAKRLLEQVAKHAESAPDKDVRVAVAVALQRQRGGGFDRLTKTKFAAKLLQGLDEEGLRAYVTHLQEAFLSPATAKSGAAAVQNGAHADSSSEHDSEDEDEEADEASPEDAGRRWAVEQLSGVMAMSKEAASARMDTLHFLALHAFFTVDTGAAKKSEVELLKKAAQCDPPVSAAVRQLCAARLVSGVDAACKAAATAQRPAEGKQVEAGGDKDGAEEAGQKRRGMEDAALRDVTQFLAQMQDSKGVSLAAELPEELLSAVTTLRALAARADKGARKADAAPEAAAQQRAFAALSRWLQLYLLGDPEGLDADLAEELTGIHADAFAKPGKTGKKKGASEEDKPAPWMDRLMDVLLSLLSVPAATLPSAPLRDAVDSLFRSCAAHLTSAGMDDLLRVAAFSNTAADGIFEGGESEEESEEEEVEESGEEGSEEESDDENDESSEEEEAAEAEVQVAAHSGRPLADAMDEDEASTSGSDMDDDAMEESGMDAKIAAVLRGTAEAKASVQKTKEAVTQLRFRVIALLEAYARKSPEAGLLARALPVLLSSLRHALRAGPAQQALAERLRGLVGNKLCKAKASGVVEAEEAAAVLRKLLSLASRGEDKVLLQTASTAFLYVLRHSPAIEAHQAAKDALADYFTKKKSRLSIITVKAMLRTAPSPEWAPVVIGHHQSARTDFLKCEALQLLLITLQPAKEHQPAAAAAASKELPALAGLLVSVVEGPSEKKQRAAEALGCACGILEALRRLLPDQDVLFGRAADLQTAVSAMESSATASRGKVGSQLRRLSGLLQKGGAKDQPQKKAPEVKGAKVKSSPVAKSSPAKRKAPAEVGKKKLDKAQPEKKKKAKVVKEA
ncbi:hypothetical protein WJX75_007153 [Coccomyxa subellipsoidea]|uniref:DNA polymerase V n=1 Tax=Coccomyxa subellipsoidea TaxID=248742 RepID=A0ABR2YEB8_9CHLO